MKTSQLNIYLFILTTLFSLGGHTSTGAGTFVVVQGDVKVLRPAVENIPGPRLSFEGQTYIYERARIGRRVLTGELIQTGSNGRTKVVFPNGDHFMVGNGSTLKLPDPPGTRGANPDMKVNHGRVRSVVSKDSPRSQMRVETPTVTAGVRGTDFFTRYNGGVGSEVTVIRGIVSVESNDKADSNDKTENEKKKEPIHLERGRTAIRAPQSPQVQVARTTREELIVLQKDSTLKTEEEDVIALPTTVQKEIKELTEKSRQTALKDIQSEDPELFKRLTEKKEDISPQEINAAAIAAVYVEAPAQAPRRKPSAGEIEAIGKDVYEKYFRQ